MTGRAAREGLMVVCGRIGFVALWFGAVLLVYRGLGQDEAGLAQAGLFAVAIALVKLFSGCIVDPGDVALMRRAPDLLRTDAPAAFRLLRAAFALRIAATLAVGAALLLLAGLVGRFAAPAPSMDMHSMGPLMGWVAAALLADALFRSVMVVLQAQERFPALVLLEGAMQVARLAAILVLWAGGLITVDGVLGAYVAVAFLAALGGAAILLPPGLLASAAIGRDDVLELLGALKWLVPGMLIGALNDRLDVLLVYNLGGADGAGRYGAMVTLALVPDLVAGSLAAILQPRIARLRQEGRYDASQRLFLRVALPGVLVAYLAALALAAPVIGLVLGSGYAPGVPILLWLLAGTLFWLAVTPLPLAMVAVHAPRRLALVAVVQSALVLAVGLPLFRLSGEVGMAQGVCVMRVGVALVLYAMARRMAPGPIPPALAEEGACASPAR